MKADLTLPRSKDFLCTVILPDGKAYDVCRQAGTPLPPERPIAVLAQGSWPEVSTFLEATADILKRTSGGAAA